ncbi:MAG TPA: cytochrome c peroxidase [Bryobacteraceae bacterium]|nr:cytochrome c peroxidase [Bryobacteraceae bacterium]
MVLKTPLGLPPVAVPQDNPLTAEVIELGRQLFFSPVLSVDRSLSCATCHDPKHAFADRHSVSAGVHGAKGTRNTPTVLNAVYYRQQFWDGRAASLEAQVAGPMLSSVEMGHSLESLVKSCSDDPDLRESFESAFGTGPVTLVMISRAIAAFERTLLSGNAPFDRYQYRGDKSALNASAARGLQVFLDAGKGNCAGCHVIGRSYALFTDGAFHNLGVGLSPEGEIVDAGRFTQTRRAEDRGAFRTPSLRNVAVTAPYMHDGSLKTLKEVVDFYVGGGSSNPYLDAQIKPLTHLTKQERADLVEFLLSLTGNMPSPDGKMN